MIEKVTIVVNEETKKKIVNYYGSIRRENSGQYIEFFGQDKNLTLTVYSSKKKEDYKVFFQGDMALYEARRWDKNAEATLDNEKKEKAPTKAEWEVLDTQIGSDEVGTGDFFGPICVCAAYVRKQDIEKLRRLGVDDSKRLKDEQIRKIGKILVRDFEYSQLSLNNEKYNQLVDKDMNMNEMKAKMHNRCLLNLKKKHPQCKNMLIDQFAAKTTYYKYLEKEKDVVKDIIFKTKGESYFPSVAVGSIIARYSFLQKLDALSKKYKMEIPHGASGKVTQFAKQFIKKYGFDELDKIVKKNFVNYEELTKLF